MTVFLLQVMHVCYTYLRMPVDSCAGICVEAWGGLTSSIFLDCSTPTIFSEEEFLS